MAVINFAHREITAKVVYFGAMGAGCNTNVRKLYEALEAPQRSKLHKFGPGGTDERSWYFDYTQGGSEGDLNGFQLRVRVYSLPGGISLHAHRMEVMQGADAIVFVADARSTRLDSNMQSMLDLEEMLGELGLELSAVPVVIQVNHTDRPGAEDDDKVTFDLNPYNFPVIRAAAAFGEGIVETHNETLGATVARIRDHLAGNQSAIQLTAVHRATREKDGDIIRKHIEAIQAESPETPSSSLDELDGDLGNSPYADLPEGGRVEVAFQPRDFAGAKPVAVLGAELLHGRVQVELVMTRINGEDPRKLTVLLANRPTDTPAVPRHPSPVVSATPPPTDRIADHLPASVPLRATPTQEPAGRGMALLLGVVGFVGGVVVGALLLALIVV